MPSLPCPACPALVTWPLPPACPIAHCLQPLSIPASHYRSHYPPLTANFVQQQQQQTQKQHDPAPTGHNLQHTTHPNCESTRKSNPHHFATSQPLALSTLTLSRPLTHPHARSHARHLSPLHHSPPTTPAQEPPPACCIPPPTASCIPSQPRRSTPGVAYRLAAAGW